jgi:ATP-dependent Clp protease ATP-binding subunit ClpB
VQRHLQDPLADAIMRGDVRDGSTVRVDEGDGKRALSAT